MGYHEHIESKGDAPFFLMQLRKAAFARVYAEDKNAAIFLGRPPRMSKRFCHFQIPFSSAKLHYGPWNWDSDTEPSYLAETRWAAICASLKEEILELARLKEGPCTDRIQYDPCPTWLRQISRLLIEVE